MRGGFFPTAVVVYQFAGHFCQVDYRVGAVLLHGGSSSNAPFAAPTSAVRLLVLCRLPQLESTSRRLVSFRLSLSSPTRGIGIVADSGEDYGNMNFPVDRIVLVPARRAAGAFAAAGVAAEEPTQPVLRNG